MKCSRCDSEMILVDGIDGGVEHHSTRVYQCADHPEQLEMIGWYCPYIPLTVTKADPNLNPNPTNGGQKFWSEVRSGKYSSSTLQIT